MELQATPFSHQVGGHHSCLRVPSSHMIAKPVDEPYLERDFYEKLVHDDLSEYIPAFYGSQDVRFDSDADETEPDQASAATDVSPWAAACFMREHRKLRLAGSVVKPCILLEDLTSPFAQPCVMDLKMGVRTHPDDGGEKATRAKQKCTLSTSASHGLRICGMQRYDPKKGKFHYVDKYHGRDISREQLPEELHRFVDQEDTARVLEVLDLWLAKLGRLITVLRGYTGYRFYSSSVLLLYEGAPDRPVRADARLIDFAHTLVEPDAVDADTSLLFGFENLVELLRTIRGRVASGEHAPEAATSAAAAS